jgi:DNA polymerase III subunit delta
MKLSYKEIEPFVKAPQKAARVILVYGPDAGLAAERAATMGKTVVPDLNDPFNVCTLKAEQLVDDPARLSDEANAISMMGGDRLIRIEDGADKLTVLIKGYLENPSPSALVIIQAGELGTKSSLRALCEKAKNAAAVPCYVEDERGVSATIQGMIRDAGKNIDRDALSWLGANVSGDRRKVRSEIEKLLIYKGGEAGAIGLKDVQAACGTAGAQNFDDLAYGVGGRNAEAALRAYSVLMAEGESFVGILRVLQNHFRRLYITKARILAGEGIDEAMKKLMPEVFFKYKDSFQTQLRTWSLPALEQVLGRLNDLEAQCKQTGMPTETLCAQAILAISKSRAA